MMPDQHHTLRVQMDDNERIILAPDGANLRQLLLANDISPYAPLTKRLNCGGRGLCATCGVWVEAGEPAPEHWHDKIGSRFGYPRLSCQITVRGAMTVRILTEKVIWGQPHPKTK
ncbi:MAG: 2Fe-2S iron-sulfur cluster binding domain-containing protein [Armatimonadetes bacterium]|nr:2Fe-2S iron-sulfur cluster binding domain-containing protein [Anaerolineae bacterium]